MKATAKLQYARMAPRKVRLVADLIRGKSAKEAQTLLSFITRRAARSVLKTLRAALASAKNDFQLEESNLYISKITVDEGPKLRRFRPRARGRAFPIQKKTSHITLVLDEIAPGKIKAASPQSKQTGEAKETRTEMQKTIEAKPRFRAAREMGKPTLKKGIQRIFRRKTASYGT